MRDIRTINRSATTARLPGIPVARNSGNALVRLQLDLRPSGKIGRVELVGAAAGRVTLACERVRIRGRAVAAEAARQTPTEGSTPVPRSAVTLPI